MGFAQDKCSIDASEPAPDHLPSTLLPMVSLRKGLRPSTQRCLYSGRPAVDATPKGFTQEDWSIDAGDPAPDHLPSTLLPKVSLEQMFDHQRMALYSGLFRRRYSHGFRSGRTVHRREHAPDHLPSTLLPVVSLRKPRDEESTSSSLSSSSSSSPLSSPPSGHSRPPHPRHCCR